MNDVTPNATPAPNPATANPAPSSAGSQVLNEAPKETPAAWWADQNIKVDDETRQFYAGRNTPSLEEALKLGVHSFKHSTERNVLAKPALDKLSEWEGWSELGWKDKLDDYDLKKPDGLPEGYPFSDELQNDIKAAAHKAKIPLGMAQALVNEVFANEAKRFNDLEVQLAQQETNAKIESERKKAELTGQLKAHWGEQYNINRDLAQRAYQRFTNEATREQLDQVMGSPELVKLFAEVGQVLGEERLVSTGGGNYQNAISVQAEMDRLRADQSFQRSMNDMSHPLHAQSMKKWTDLNAKLAAINTAQAR